MAFLDKAGLERLWEHIVSLVGTKVEKVEGKGLSTEDFTTEEKIKLADIEEGATRYVHPVSEVEAGAYTKVTVDAQGHVIAGEITQPDWNQNDPNNASYIQNRTHWEESEHVVLVNNLTFADYKNGNAPKCIFIPGQKYQITWNGTLYETTCYAEGEYNIVASSDVGCPCNIDDGGGDGLHVGSTEQDWTLSIATTQVNMHYLDPKYIKDMYHEEIKEYSEEIIFSDTLDFTESKQYTTDPTGKIYEGVEYTVVFNGTSYDVVGTYSEAIGIIYLGNEELLLGNNPEVGLPFGIGENSQMFGIFVMSNGTHEITVTIKAQTTTTVHKVPEKYLPNPKPEVYNAGQKTGVEGAEIFNNYVNNTATGKYSHAEGWNTHAPGEEGHAEGLDTHAEGAVSHAEGIETYATGDYSHAEGYGSEASGEIAHAEGRFTEARGQYSHSEGNYTIAGSKDQHVQGRFNVVDSSNKYADIIGNGDSESVRSNAATVDWDGNAWFAGDVYVGGTGQDDENASILATQEYVDNALSNVNVTTSWNDLEDKPFGEEAELIKLVERTPSSEDDEVEAITAASLSNPLGVDAYEYRTPYNWSTDFMFEVGKTYVLEVNGVQHRVVAQYGTDEYITVLIVDKIAYMETAIDIIGNGKTYLNFAWNQELGDTITIAAYEEQEIVKQLDSKYIPDDYLKAPISAQTGDLLMYNGTEWVKLSKADLIAEIVAALPQVITSTTDVESGATSSYPEGTLYVVYE